MPFWVRAEDSETTVVDLPTPPLKMEIGMTLAILFGVEFGALHESVERNDWNPKFIADFSDVKNKVGVNQEILVF